MKGGEVQTQPQFYGMCYFVVGIAPIGRSDVQRDGHL